MSRAAPVSRTAVRVVPVIIVADIADTIDVPFSLGIVITSQITDKAYFGSFYRLASNTIGLGSYLSLDHEDVVFVLIVAVTMWIMTVPTEFAALPYRGNYTESMIREYRVGKG